jgi:hypothetical protein
MEAVGKGCTADGDGTAGPALSTIGKVCKGLDSRDRVTVICNFIILHLTTVIVMGERFLRSRCPFIQLVKRLKLIA